MSVSVVVFRRPPPADGGSKALFSHDVAGTFDFHEYWHEPATRLGLKLIAGVYNRGRCFQREDFDPLVAELSAEDIIQPSD